ncbi:pantoate--beta-alanine ligase [Hippea alviniae]|uniref:pantoate--beta-alanine ligase n=1 Tax=Hippea alviniae TaxID=1279027 RepID=UPI0003B549F1|nr:pantoate--beta-alanine ligase [Hippea alviniae]
MRIIYSADEMQQIANKYRELGKKIGFVPTMGYLHEGHLSLVRKAKEDNDVVFVSIFVNPLQFAPNEDLDKYPRDLRRDEELLKEEGVDFLFYPAVEKMYPDGFQTYVEVEKLTKVLEGKSRPTHFKGVTTVVLKLFNITKPHRAYFGKKDAQQLLVIRRMVKDLNLDIDVVGMPIVREEDGLAMSSRNKYLNEEERKQAVCLYKSLKKAEELINSGETDAKEIIDEMKKVIKSYPLAEIDYISINRLSDLEELKTIEKGNTLVSLAVRIGQTRLIDNMWF